MATLNFGYDQDLEAYVSDVLELLDVKTAHVQLGCKAPVVTLKEEEDGGWANFGETPQQSDVYEIKLQPDKACRVKLATPVEVIEAWTF